MADSPIPVYLTQLPYAYETDNIKFRQMLQQLNEWFGVTRVDAFQGQYKLPQVVEIGALNSGRAELTLQGVTSTEPTSVFEFELLTRDFRRVSVRNDGSYKAPRQGQHLLIGTKTTLSGSGRQAYTLSDVGLQMTDIESGQKSQLPVPTSFPAFSWATAVAYDKDLDIVTVVTLGGEGFFYRYDAKRKQWLDYRSLNNIDITSLAYDPQAKRYAAWTSDGALLSISSKGDLLGSKAMKPKLSGFGTLYDGGNASPPPLTLAPRGAQIALVHIQDNEVSMIWTYNEKTEQAQLTYKRAAMHEKTESLR